MRKILYVVFLRTEGVGVEDYIHRYGGCNRRPQRQEREVKRRWREGGGNGVRNCARLRDSVSGKELIKGEGKRGSSSSLKVTATLYTSLSCGKGMS